MQLSLDSKFRDLYEHPLGRDIIDRLLYQIGKPDWPVSKIGGKRLKSLKRLAEMKVNPQIFGAALDLLNAERGMLSGSETAPSRAWWKEAVFYRVCPRGFSSDGIRGIAHKLSYIRGLGADAIWLRPVCDFAGSGDGYGCWDYYGINKETGTMRDMEALIVSVHRHGMKLVMDLPVNHTAGCNWDNPAVRQELHRITRWWLGKGVDGLNLCEIYYVSMTDALVNGVELSGELIAPTSVGLYFYGPRLHEYLRELRREVFMPYNAFIAGAASGVGPMGGRLLSDEYREELDMVVKTDCLEIPGSAYSGDNPHHLAHMRNYFHKNLNADLGHGWHALFYNKNDSPRMLCKIDPAGQYAEPLAKMLAVLQFTLRGTPFIEYGDEIGARDYTALQWDEAARQQEVNESVLRFYKKIIALRKKTPACIYGALEFVNMQDERMLCFRRLHDEGSVFVEVNLTDAIVTSVNPEGAMFVLGNYRNLISEMQPYEARVYVYFAN